MTINMSEISTRFPVLPPGAMTVPDGPAFALAPMPKRRGPYRNLFKRGQIKWVSGVIVDTQINVRFWCVHTACPRPAKDDGVDAVNAF